MKNNIIFKGLFLLLAGISIYSCTTSKEINLMQEKGSYSAMQKLEDYRLQVYDQISCTILTRNKDFAAEFNGVVSSTESEGVGGTANTGYTIYENGNISIPYFGEIEVKGLTIAEAEVAIQREMVQSYPDAQVVVRLMNKVFYVVSNTNNATVQVYKDNLTIFQALAMMGRVDEVMDFSKVKIVRLQEDGRSIEKIFDLRSTAIIESEFYYIQPNDVIYFSTSGKRSFFQIRSATQVVTTITTTLLFVIGLYARYK
ncbi:polysaccharide biosynthesis/export family protein [Dysgonomonas sp. 520]|uniref:polysaccharide biosynthesis/export family protein n=1 Tax=Dysgonomonas sp. 520 TaxID=2302931 RepID=UPI0013D22B9E|nr:polysaccharide biosynthesis/export family protein [Dysgonomonas sp. 520]NDW08503.1 hypothetical protein [Dysgonomonas sp. 520]